MEILFFRIFKYTAGVRTNYLTEIVHSPVVQPFLPITPCIKQLLVYRGRFIGLVDLYHLFHIQSESTSGDIVVLRFENMEFGIQVRKIFNVKAVSPSKISPPDSKTFIPDYLLEGIYRNKNIAIPIISPGKIIHYPELESFWMTASDNSVIKTI